VLGSDDEIHLAYELFIVNQSSAPVTLTSVEILDPAKQDAVLDADAQAPKSLLHHFTMTAGDATPPQTVQSAGGNYVVVDIGQGRYAFYAHMQPGSLKVKVGDRVKTGQVLGLLGNTVQVRCVGVPGQVTPVDTSALTGVHTKEMPLNLEVISFGTWRTEDRRLPRRG
jgi:hypothetical protein